MKVQYQQGAMKRSGKDGWSIKTWTEVTAGPLGQTQNFQPGHHESCVRV